MHVFETQIFLNELDPEAVRVELYADGQMGTSPMSQEMKRGRQMSEKSGAHLYHATVPAVRPSADYTARVKPSFNGVAVPLEEPRILWER